MVVDVLGPDQRHVPFEVCVGPAVAALEEGDDFFAGEGLGCAGGLEGFFGAEE